MISQNLLELINNLMCQQKSNSREVFSNEELYKRLSIRQQQLSELFLEHLSETKSTARSGKSANKSARLKVLTRIVGGIPALEGEFDECSLIGTRNPNGTIEWFCTGVLIHPKIVITAAHCIDTGGAYVTALGTNNQNNLRKSEIINTRKAVIHPQYSERTQLNDIAVLVLQTPAKTQPIPLASTQAIAAAKEVELVGFGNDDIASTKGFGIKRKVEVDVISLRRDTNEDLNQEESIFGYESDLEFVAGGEGFDTCNGDSGGPVYIVNGEGRLVAGLTSRATANSVNPCGDGGIYTRVDVHTPFINSFIQNS